MQCMTNQNMQGPINGGIVGGAGPWPCRRVLARFAPSQTIQLRQSVANHRGPESGSVKSRLTCHSGRGAGCGITPGTLEQVSCRRCPASPQL